MRTLRSLEEMEDYAREFVGEIAPSSSEARVIGLKGELGSGKTAFVKGVAKALGITETVTSPTFVIEKIYTLKNRPFSHLIHIDAYRLEDAKELQNLGFEELLKDAKNLIFIEWPERVSGILPSTISTLSFAYVDETTRTVHDEED